MKFRNALIVEAGIKPSNTVDRPARLELTFILGNKEEKDCFIRLNDINFGDKLLALMSFTGISELSEIVGQYVKLVLDEHGNIVCIGHILEDDYFYIEAKRSNIEDFKRFTEEDIKEMENK